MQSSRQAGDISDDFQPEAAGSRLQRCLVAEMCIGDVDLHLKCRDDVTIAT